MKTSIRLKAALIALALLASGALWGAGFLEREIYFSEADIQAQVEKSGTMRKSYGDGLVVVALIEPPGIRYDVNAKAFFLERPVANSVQSQAIGRESEPMARQAITQLMTNYFRSKPVYILREDGTAQEKAARWLLRSIRIEPGRVVAIMSAD